MSTTPNQDAAQPPAGNAAEEALFRHIAEQSKTDPLIGAKMGGKEILQRSMHALKNDRGVHMESLVALLGALAGYACQASVRAQALAQGKPEAAVMNVVQAKDGSTYYLGDAISHAMAQAEYSVWGIVAAGAQDAGCAKLPDLVDFFKHATATIGTDKFGKYRLSGSVPGELPQTYLRLAWVEFHKVIVKFCPDPALWPVLLAIALRDAIFFGKGVLDPGVALHIAMDAAVAMSMVELKAK